MPLPSSGLAGVPRPSRLQLLRAALGALEKGSAGWRQVLLSRASIASPPKTPTPLRLTLQAEREAKAALEKAMLNAGKDKKGKKKESRRGRHHAQAGAEGGGGGGGGGEAAPG